MHAYTDTYTHSSHMHAGKRMNACAFMHFGASTGHRRRALRPRGKGPAACMHACFGVTADTHLLGAAEDGCMHAYTHREGPALHASEISQRCGSPCDECAGHARHTPDAERNTAMISATSRPHHRTAAFITISGNVPPRVRTGLPPSLSALSAARKVA